MVGTENPVCVEVMRGDIVESFHRGRIAVVSVDSGLEYACGDIDVPIYPRSAIKAFQALSVLENGAVDNFAFSDSEIAIMAASHNGEEQHVATVAAMLAKMGLSVEDLECGSHWPMSDSATRMLAAAGKKPSPLHNNCSGKHAGMLAFCLAKGYDSKGYIHLQHPVQQHIMQVMGELCEFDLSTAAVARDGCSVPTWALPLRNVALGFAKLASGKHISASQNKAFRRLSAAVLANPFMVAGTNRYCSEVMQKCENVFLKVGAEGVYCAALIDFGLGVALKCDDGSSRAAEMMVSAVLSKFDVKNLDKVTDTDRSESLSLQTDSHGSKQIVLKNFNGYEVGRIRAVDLVG